MVVLLPCWSPVLCWSVLEDRLWEPVLPSRPVRSRSSERARILSTLEREAYLDIRKTGETGEGEECEEIRRDQSLLINGDQIGENRSEQNCNNKYRAVAEKIQEKTAILVHDDEITRKQIAQNELRSELRNQTEIQRNQNERKGSPKSRTSGGPTKKCNKPKKKEEKKKIVNTQNIQTPKITETSISSSKEFESPPLLSTMQEVKDYMGYNGDVKFLVSNELSKSEEFGNFIATCNKKNVLEASLLRNDCDTKEDATSPSAGARAKMCWSCHDTIGGPTGLSKCRGCRRAWYCDMECQAADWERHQDYCFERQKVRQAANQAEPTGEKL